MSKRKGPGRPNRSSGRYTPPKQPPLPSVLPPPLALPRSQTRSGGTAEDREFWADYNQADHELHERCNALLPDQPVTANEWLDADLISMDGLDATDDELIAYWAAHRKAAELDWEYPDLAYIFDALQAGEDPAAKLAAEVERFRAEEW